MQHPSSDAGPVEPPTTLGPAPDDPSQTVSLPDGALDAGCYVEGPQTLGQTALLHSWCVEDPQHGPQVARLPEMPRAHHLKIPLAMAITRGVHRHGAEPQWMTEEMRAETRAEYEN